MLYPAQTQLSLRRSFRPFVGLAPILALMAFHAPAIAAGDFPKLCEAAPPKQNADGNYVYDIDRIWSGTRVELAAAANKDGILFAYYDQDRFLTVADLQIESSHICRVRLDSRFGGWDSHNSVKLARSPDGTLHVAANMHDSPLVYAHTDGSGDIESLRLSSMTGSEETHVTYPSFIGGHDGGPLFFMYRDGRSGAGAWIVNTWEGARWSRVSEAISGRSHAGSVSAYPSPATIDRAGAQNFAIVWRHTADVKTNFAISFAKTRDFKTWTGSDGVSRPAPLSVDRSDIIENVGENAGLLNSARLVLDAQDGPVVFYTRYAPDGKNALMAARPSGGGTWEVREIARSENTTILEGGGSIAIVPRFGVTRKDNTALISIVFPGQPTQRLHVDLTSLAVGPGQAETSRAPRHIEQEPDAYGLQDVSHILNKVYDLGNPTRPRGWVAWVAQAPNRDRPRSCTAAAPRACDPSPTTLRYFPP